MKFPTLTPQFFKDAGVANLDELIPSKAKELAYIFGGGSYGALPGTCSMEEHSTPNNVESAVEMVRAKARNGSGAMICNVTDPNAAKILKSHGWVVNAYRGGHGYDVYSCFLAVREAENKGAL